MRNLASNLRNDLYSSRGVFIGLGLEGFKRKVDIF
jgi:hypothetical protein